jgi:glucose/arabinose dehydrogenase
MRRLSNAGLAIFALAGCSLASPPQSEAEVAAELARVEPPKAGRWSSHFDLMAFEVNGAPAEVADRLQRELAARGRLGQVTCVTPGMIRDMFKGKLTTYDGAACRVIAFHVQDGAYTATLQCNYANELTGTIELAGQSGPENSRDSAQIELALISNPEKRVSYQLESRSEHLGACTGK